MGDDRKAGAEPRDTQDRAVEAMIHEAHRRPACPVFAPALLRHRAFHFGTKTEIEKSVLRLLSTLPFPSARARAASGKIDPLDSMLLDVEISSPKLKACLPDWRLRFRIEMYTEYLTITLILDSFGYRNTPAKSPSRTRIEQISQEDCGKDDAHGCVQYLFDAVWREVDDALELSNLDNLGLPFADFCGLTVIPAPMAPLKLGENEVQLPDGDTMRDRRALTIDAKVRDFVRNRENLFAAVLGLGSADPEAARQNANVVMCGMLDGAAIYGSSLGASSEGRTKPQRYFVAYNGLSANQLGRFLRRMHVQGEGRLAALIDLSVLRKASDDIRETGEDLSRYIEKFETGAGNFESLPFLKKWTEIGDACSGGLVYRVNRSRIYVQAFRERMEDLRIVRIEGWQPYDEFVRRNLYKTYDFISRIGERYEALGGRIEKFNAAQQTKSIVERTSQARDLLQLADVVGRAAFTYYGGCMIGTALWIGLSIHAHGSLNSVCTQISWLCGDGMSARDDIKDAMTIVGWIAAFVLYWPLKRLVLPRSSRVSRP